MMLAEKIRPVYVCVCVCLCSLMQQWSDDCASFGVSLKHQCVQVGQEGVTDVQDVPGRLGEGGIPSNGILSLTEEEYKSSNYRRVIIKKIKRIWAFWACEVVAYIVAHN